MLPFFPHGQVRLRSEKKPGVAGRGAASPASPGTRANCCVFLSTQDSFPARFGGVHFVNQPWYIHALYTLIKPFLKDKTRKRVMKTNTQQWGWGVHRGTITVPPLHSQSLSLSPYFLLWFFCFSAVPEHLSLSWSLQMAWI